MEESTLFSLLVKNLLVSCCVQGSMFLDSRVQCMVSVGFGHMVLGCQSGRVWVYDSISHTPKHCSMRLNDSVISLMHFVW